MGLEHRGDAVTNYFDSLLPDSAEIRRRLRRRFHARSDDAFGLLSVMGQDCVGAVQLMPPGIAPEGWNRVEVEQLTDADVDSGLASVTSEQLLGQPDEDDLRIAIAGAQEKTAPLRMGGRWYRPMGATPTTYILKPPLGLVSNMRADMSDSVENEWLCGQLMNALGIATAETEIGTFGDSKALIVTRFDHRWQGVPEGGERKARFKSPQGSWIARLPQEDFCQALSIAPDRKYESDGGPSVRDCLGVLANSEQRTGQRRSCHVRARPRTTGVLDAGCDGWSCEDFLDPASTRRPVPTGADVRRAVGLADHRARPETVVLPAGQTRHGASGPERARPTERDPCKALAATGRRVRPRRVRSNDSHGGAGRCRAARCGATLAGGLSEQRLVQCGRGHATAFNEIPEGPWLTHWRSCWARMRAELPGGQTVRPPDGGHTDGLHHAA